MTNNRIRVAPEARQELDDAFTWYSSRSPRAAEAFLKEVDHAMSSAAESPKMWPSLEAGFRRYLLDRFPYSLVYRETDSGIEVLAVAHQKRRPRYWQSRISS